MAKKSKAPSFTTKLQYSEKSKVYRVKILKPDGTELLTGPTDPDPFHARMLALHAAKQKNWEGSETKKLLDLLQEAIDTGDDSKLPKWI